MCACDLRVSGKSTSIQIKDSLKKYSRAAGDLSQFANAEAMVDEGESYEHSMRRTTAIVPLGRRGRLRM